MSLLTHPLFSLPINLISTISLNFFCIQDDILPTKKRQTHQYLPLLFQTFKLFHYPDYINYYTPDSGQQLFLHQSSEVHPVALVESGGDNLAV